MTHNNYDYVLGHTMHIYKIILYKKQKSVSDSTAIKLHKWYKSKTTDQSMQNVTFIPSIPVQTARTRTNKQNAIRTAETARINIATASLEKTLKATIVIAAAITTISISPTLINNHINVFAADMDTGRRLKVSGGSASTTPGAKTEGSQVTKTVVKTVTRGISLENTDFSNIDFEGVSFQQSILRQADFTNCNLRNASFFDADLSGAKFNNADMSNSNLELANLRGADLTGANLTGAYISSTTKFNGIIIDGSDWTDTFIRKDQQNYLCSIANGTNQITGIDTRDSLLCPLQEGE